MIMSNLKIQQASKTYKADLGKSQVVIGNGCCTYYGKLPILAGEVGAYFSEFSYTQKIIPPEPNEIK